MPTTRSPRLRNSCVNGKAVGFVAEALPRTPPLSDMGMQMRSSPRPGRRSPTPEPPGTARAHFDRPSGQTLAAPGEPGVALEVPDRGDDLTPRPTHFLRSVVCHEARLRRQRPLTSANASARRVCSRICVKVPGWRLSGSGKRPACPGQHRHRAVGAPPRQRTARGATVHCARRLTCGIPAPARWSR